MKLAAIVGSIRQNSYNLFLAKTMQERYSDRFSLEILDIRSLPYYNPDEENNPNDAVNIFKKKVKEADGLIIITPEYNWSIPGVLKNALDWLSRGEKEINGKPMLTAGVSTGFLGTIRAQLHLREILASLGMQAKLLPPAGNEILINNAKQKFDEKTGKLIDEATLQFLDGVVEKFIRFVQENKQAN